MNLKATLAAAAIALTLPFSAHAITFDGDLLDGDVVEIGLGDIFIMDIFGDAVDGAGSASYGFTATEDLIALNTSTLNPDVGFAGATVSWTENADGTGVISTLSTADILADLSISTTILLGETKYLYATWTNVTEDRSNFDFRVVTEPVPVPAGILLMGTALAGFGVMRRRKKAA